MAGPEQAARQSSEVLGQQRALGMCPVRAASVGFVIVGGLGYMVLYIKKKPVLYIKKKPEASAGDVAKVISGVSGTTESTNPRN